MVPGKQKVKLLEETKLQGFHLRLYSDDDELFIILSKDHARLETWEYETEGRAHAEYKLARAVLIHALGQYR